MTENPGEAETRAGGSLELGDAERARLGAGRLSPAVGLGLTAAAAVLFFGGGAALSGSRPVWALPLLPLLAFLLPALLLARLARAERQILPASRVPLRGALAGAVILLGASLLALALAGLIGRWAGPAPGEEEMWRWVAGFGPGWRLFLLALVPGLCEEVFFRGALLACLRPWGPVPACLASSLLFAIFHGSLLRLLPVAVLGVALAAVVWLTGNLWLAVAGHVFHNSLVLAALHYYGASGEPGGAPLVSAGVFGLFMLAGGFWTMLKKRD